MRLHPFEQLAGELASDAAAHLQRLGPAVPSDEWRVWHLLTTCVLSSQVPYRLALAATDALSLAGLPWLEGENGTKRFAMIHEILRAPLLPGGQRYRFPRSRAAWLAGGIARVEVEFGTLNALLMTEPDAKKLRRLLTATIPGVGPKQASMFIRDARISLDVAVIDRHVVRFMRTVFGSDASPPKLSTIESYERYEDSLRQYTTEWKVSLGAADLAIWAASRAMRACE